MPLDGAIILLTPETKFFNTVLRPKTSALQFEGFVVCKILYHQFWVCFFQANVSDKFTVKAIKQKY